MSPDTATAFAVEEAIDQWRDDVRRRGAATLDEITHLEERLREQFAALSRIGLANDEALMVAVKRVHLPDSRSTSRREALIVFALALGAATLVKLPALLVGMRDSPDLYVRNASLFALPLLMGYFGWKRELATRTCLWLAAAVAAAVLFENIYPFSSGASTELLSASHLCIALWFAVGVAYAGGAWNRGERRMDFIRFSGEFFIYYVLIALGGGVFTGCVAMIFTAIGIKPDVFMQYWLVPCGAAGGVMVAAWLVEAKQHVVENMAPVLTKLFTPLFTVLLLTFLAAVVVTGRGVGFDRQILIAFDLLLAVVLGLLLYNISARDPQAPSNGFDVIQIVLVVSALVVDAVALWAIASRISEFGFSANRVAALGENVILLVNLAWSAVLYTRFARGHGAFASLERWQTGYLPVYAVWAAIVVVAFPPLFHFA